MISNSEIRARAREILGGGIFKSEWLYALLIVLVVSLVSGLLSATYVGSIIVYGVLMVAAATYFVGRVRGEIEYKDINSAIEGCKKNPVGSILTGLLYTLFISLATFLFIVPGIILSCSYAMTFYIRNDNPEIGVMDALKESARMMNGHKMQYFTLQLSFIGWLIVGSFCFGIGSLWVSAYMETSKAIFYEELKNSQF